MDLRKLSVLQVLPELNIGGVERAVLETAQALAEQGHHSHVLSAGGRQVSALQAGGSRHHCLAVGRKSPLTCLLVGRVRRLIRTLAPDLVHVRSRLPAWVIHAALRGARPRPALISTVHGAYSVNAYSRIMIRADRVIAVSDFIRRYILGNYPGAAAERIELIPDGVCPRQFPRGHKPPPDWLAAWRKEWPGLQDRRLVTLAARLSPRKGLEQFIEVMARLRAVRPDIRGVIAGEAHPSRRRYLRRLQARIAAQGLGEAISFIGGREDIREVMAVSDVVLSLSRAPEAFGRTALEALSLGVPVVACDHGGISEILGRLLPAGLAPCGNAEAVCRRVLDFLREPPAIPENTELTLAACLDKTLALYQRAAVAGEGAGRR